MRALENEDFELIRLRGGWNMPLKSVTFFRPREVEALGGAYLPLVNYYTEQCLSILQVPIPSHSHYSYWASFQDNNANVFTLIWAILWSFFIF